MISTIATEGTPPDFWIHAFCGWWGFVTIGCMWWHDHLVLKYKIRDLEDEVLWQEIERGEGS